MQVRRVTQAWATFGKWLLMLLIMIIRGAKVCKTFAVSAKQAIAGGLWGSQSSPAEGLSS